MADDSAEEKIYEASQKRLNKLREEGNIPRSQELTGAVGLLVLMIYFILSREQIFDRFVILMRDVPLFQPRDFQTRVMIGSTMALQITFEILLPFILIVFISAVATTLFDVGGFIFLLKPPDFAKFNPVEGIKNMVSKDSLIKLLRSLIKLPIFMIVCWNTNKKHVNDAFWSPTCGLPCSYEVLAVITIKIIVIGMLFLFLSAVLDFVITRWKFRKDNMMTLTEMKEEQKEDSGSPDVKRARRRIQQENQQTAGLVGINNASVIFKTAEGNIIALSYKPDLVGVPIVAARGSGDSAINLEKRAKENKTPFFNDQKLAGELFEKARVGTAIPKEYFSSVARALMQLGLVKR